MMRKFSLLISSYFTQLEEIKTDLIFPADDFY